MKLKKLEILGFKSFLDKVSVDFPPGISAIVGPNGCGKSNIMDALKWVMGEQKARDLRGKSMDDVIFAGTAGAHPLNMAEVSLTLTNDNGSTPEEFKDFSEIMVTRRLYRSGESAYLLNKKACRLKDIHNLFLGSGMGPRAYGIIQQGNIGAITDASPEERRVFIEEAAGVTRYKNRKTEALRKLDSTQQNLLRLNDIIAEVERQMGTKKRQAKRAETFQKYTASIRQNDILICLHSMDQVTQELEKTQSLVLNLQNDDIAHVTKIKQLDAAVEDIKVSRWQKNQEITQLNGKKTELQRITDKKENDLAHLHKEIKRLTQETAELKLAQKNLEDKKTNIEHEMAQINDSQKLLNEEIYAIESNIQVKEEESRTINSQFERLKSELEVKKESLLKLVAQEAKLKNIFLNITTNKENIQRRIKKIAEEEVQVRNQLVEIEQKKEKMTLVHKEIQTNIKEINEKITITKNRLDEKNVSLSQTVREVQIAEKEHTKIKSKVQTLKKMADNYDWYKNGVKAIMKRFKTVTESTGINTNKKVIGLLAEQIEPKPGYEKAVEAALGDALEYILVDEQKIGSEAISYLQDSGQGRCGFIPVYHENDPTRQHVHPPIENENHILNYVTTPSQSVNVAQGLLHDFIITDDLKDALVKWNSNGKDKNFVTKNGNIVTKEGILIGGSDGNIGILQKKNEVKSLENQLEIQTRTLSNLLEKQRDLEESVLALEHDLNGYTIEKNDLIEEEMEAQKKEFKIAEELKHISRHLNIIQLEQEQLLGEEDDLDQEMQSQQSELSAIEDLVKSTQTQVKSDSDEIASISEDRHSINELIMDEKLQLTTLQSKRDNQANTLKRLTAFYNDDLNRMEQLKDEITRKINKHEIAQQKLSDYEIELTQNYDTLKQIEDNLQTKQATYQEIDLQLKENDKAISEIKTERDEVIKKLRYLEIQKTEQQMKRKNIEEKIEERYHAPLQSFRQEFGVAHKRLILKEDEIKKIEDELADLRQKISHMKDINMTAIEEYKELNDRFDFLLTQKEDLNKAIVDLHAVIKKINKITQERFMSTFDLINEKLAEVFPQLFSGGTAKLVLTTPENLLETGVELMIHPPGKKLTRLSLLSGGEKALSAIAFIFSIFLIKPTSFCLMDEIDAPLDEANTDRFNDLLRIIGEKSQIVMITHNKRSMEFADMLFGITMEKKGISKLVSVNLMRN